MTVICQKNSVLYTRLHPLLLTGQPSLIEGFDGVWVVLSVAVRQDGRLAFELDRPLRVRPA
jgi:hypothetical protein